MYSSLFFSNDVDYDTWTNEENHELRIDMPGVQKEDVETYVKDGYLEIKWDRHSADKSTRKSLYGKKSITFKLPSDIKIDEIKCKLNNGVLDVNIPKKIKVESKRIPILTG